MHTLHTNARPRRGVLTHLVAIAIALGLGACDGITGSGDDPCFDADKTQDVDMDDVRIHVINDSGTGNVSASFSGPNGQTQLCDPVRTDIATPTNVVFFLDVGDNVTISFSSPDVVDVSHTCVLTADAYGPAEGSPGNAFVGITMGPAESTLVCEAGFEFSARSEVGP